MNCVAGACKICCGTGRLVTLVTLRLSLCWGAVTAWVRCVAVILAEIEKCSTPELELDDLVFGVFGKVGVGQLGLFESYQVGAQLLDISQSWS